MTGLYQLFLDDERVPWKVDWVKLPPGHFQIIRNYHDFVKIIQDKGVPTFVSFDHDLALEHYPAFQKNGGIDNMHEIPYDKMKEKTGRDCAKWLVEYCLDNNIKIPNYQVHSMNPVGAENIRSMMENGKKLQTHT